MRKTISSLKAAMSLHVANIVGMIVDVIRSEQNARETVTVMLLEMLASADYAATCKDAPETGTSLRNEYLLARGDILKSLKATDSVTDANVASWGVQMSKVWRVWSAAHKEGAHKDVVRFCRYSVEGNAVSLAWDDETRPNLDEIVKLCPKTSNKGRKAGSGKGGKSGKGKKGEPTLTWQDRLKQVIASARKDGATDADIAAAMAMILKASKSKKGK